VYELQVSRKKQKITLKERERKKQKCQVALVNTNILICSSQQALVIGMQRTQREESEKSAHKGAKTSCAKPTSKAEQPVLFLQ
jgi:heme/copper-type cytochrome/quinol oxidase subunit 3